MLQKCRIALKNVPGKRNDIVNRRVYLIHQTLLKIRYQKKRYMLYVLSFYVGLLFPAFCIANIRSVDQVIYYTVFDNMEDSVQIDWSSEKFDLLNIESAQNYSVSAYYEEDFPQWDHQYIPIKGIDEHYFYLFPQIRGRYFQTDEFQKDGRVCLIDKNNADKYFLQTGDQISVHGESLNIIGIIMDTKYEGIIMPYQTMKKIYQYKENIQFTGTFMADTEEEKDRLVLNVTEELKKDENTAILEVTDGGVLYKNALATKIQWRVVRGIFAAVSALFFLLNETIVLMGKMEKEKQTIGIYMALGASERETKGAVLFETMCVTFFAALLVLATLRPLARLVSLESAVLLDCTLVFWFLMLAFFMCELLSVVVMKSIKDEQISNMIKMRDL